MFLATAGKLVVNQLMERNTTMATTAKAMSTEELKWTMVMCEVILCPSTPDSMRWLYSKVHVLPVKEKNHKCISKCYIAFIVETKYLASYASFTSHNW
jgi:hypothetical protein